MASRILHLAAAKLILDEHPAADEKRFRLGSILPDAGERVSAHFRVRIDGGTKTMMALGGFRARFADKMDDSLYLGYYLHLVQDIVFRKVFYLDHGWKVDSPQKVERLYDDYRILNTWAIEKFALREDLTAPEDFSAEPICAVSDFALPEFLAELHADFTTPPPPGRLRILHQSHCGGISDRRRAALPAGDRGAARRENRRGRARLGVGGAAGTKSIHSV